MVSLGDVRRWQHSTLDAVFQALGTRRDALVGFDDELHATRSPAGWSGPAAESAFRHHGELSERMRRLVAGVSAVRRAVDEAADAIKAVQRALGDAEYLAKRYGFTITDDGRVVQTVCLATDMDQGSEWAAVKAELVDRVEQVLRRANDIDADLASVLEKAALDHIDDGRGISLAEASQAGEAAGGLSTIGPPEGGSPGDNAGWWASLSDAERAALLKDHPEWLGNLDGLPAAVRDQANRANLAKTRERLTSEISRLEKEIYDLGQRMRSRSNLTLTNALEKAKLQLKYAQSQLPTLNVIEQTLARGDRQLLVFDPTGGHPKAAIAVGNVDTADHVAVFTPGLGSTVKSDMLVYDERMNSLKRQAENEATLAGKPSNVATITWLDYEAPQPGEIANIERSVASSNLAQKGADKLAGFLNGIDVSRQKDPHLTALGHSYGSLTTGLALQKGTGVDDAVFFGSPGVGTSRVEDLKMPAGHTWTVEAKWDGIADLGRFGTDPNQMEGMNGLSAKETTLPDGRRLNESVGHSSIDPKEGYLAPGTTSQYNMSLIVAGLHDQVMQD